MKVNAHGVSVGFLLVYECMVFGDTSDNIEEYLVHVFLLSIHRPGLIFIDSIANHVNG